MVRVSVVFIVVVDRVKKVVKRFPGTRRIVVHCSLITILVFVTRTDIIKRELLSQALRCFLGIHDKRRLEGSNLVGVVRVYSLRR